MEGQQSEVRSVEQLNIITESENEYLDSTDDSEFNEDIYLHEEIDSSDSSENKDTASTEADEENDITQPTKSEDELSTDTKIACKRRIYSESKSEGQQSSVSEHIRPCGRNGSENVNNPLEAWSILLSDEILNIIVRYTNEEIDRRRDALHLTQNDNYLYEDLSLVEFKAFLGLLYLSGLHEVTYTETIDLWSSFSFSTYRATMPRERFVFLMSCIRFDDKATHRERCEQDKFSPIREIFDKFVDNCQKYYTPHANCAVGYVDVPCPESSLFDGSRAQRGDYGLTIMLMNDVTTYYMINALLHVDKINLVSGETTHAYYLRTLTQPIHGSGRNVTCNINWPLYTHVTKTLKTDYNLTLVSMVETDDPKISDKLIRKNASKERTVMRRLKGGTMLLPCYRNGHHIGSLQSSLHVPAQNASKNEFRKAYRNIQQFYKLTQDVANTFMDLCQTYSTLNVRSTRRLHLRLFFTMLDQCRFNSFILYQLNAKNNVYVQRSFLDDLILNLIKPFIIMKINDPSTSSESKMLMSSTFMQYL